MDAAPTPPSSPPVDVPPGVSPVGVPRRDEHRDVLIVAFGVLIAALALAATISYIAFHALTTRERPTIGLPPIVEAPTSTAFGSAATPVVARNSVR